MLKLNCSILEIMCKLHKINYHFLMEKVPLMILLNGMAKLQFKI